MVCYEYAGIGQAIMEMSSSDVATWVGAIGTIVAAGIAVWLYWQSRRDAKADILARRKVLHAVLREYVTRAAAFVRETTARLHDGRFDDIEPALRMALLHMEDVDRLTDLQMRLLEFGEEGDAEIAAFIEACRRYQTTHAEWRKHIANVSFWETVEGVSTPLAITAVRGALKKVAVTVEPALAAIARYDKPRQ